MTFQKIDLTGRKFGRLVVLNESDERSSYRLVQWNCKCDCGNSVLVTSSLLLQGVTQSCGCLHREKASEVHTTHGMSKSPEYNIWVGMRDRCNNKNNERFYNYGGRGIQVCDRWNNSFEAFYTDMGPKPTPEHSIDRYPNQDGNYEPGNCRWATPMEQANNMRANVVIEHDGIKGTIAEMARHFNVPAARIYARLDQGKTVSEALNPEIREAKTYSFDGKTLTLSEWSKLTGIEITTLEYRLNNKWTLDKVFGPLIQPKTFLFQGQQLTLSEISKLSGVPYWKLHQRVHRDKMTIEEAVNKQTK